MGKDVVLKHHHFFRGELFNFWGCKCILFSEDAPISTMQQKNGAHVHRVLALPATLENENRRYLQHLYVHPYCVQIQVPKSSVFPLSRHTCIVAGVQWADIPKNWQKRQLGGRMQYYTPVAVRDSLNDLE